MSHRVRVGVKYIFYANLLDREHRDLNGRIGAVINLPGCPPANTMGHAYFQIEGERFRLVSTNSLYKLADRHLVADAMRRDLEHAEARDTQEIASHSDADGGL